MGKCQLWGLAVEKEMLGRGEGGVSGGVKGGVSRAECGAECGEKRPRVCLPSSVVRCKLAKSRTTGRQQIEIQLATGHNSRI